MVIVRSPASLSEPTYQGQRVTHWIKVLNNTKQDPPFMSAYFEGEQPILEIGPPAIPYLRSALGNQDSVAKDAYAAFWRKLPRRLQKKLPEPFPPATLRAYAARGLGLLGPNATPAVPDLIRALHDPDKWVRAAAASALGEIGPAARVAVPALITGLNDPDKNVGLSCLIGLKGAGRDSPEVLPVYQKLLSNLDSNIRSWSVLALGKMTIGRETVIKALEDALQDESRPVRLCAVDSLGGIGSAAASAVPQLLQLLELEEKSASQPDSKIMCWKILEALGKMGPAARAAVPTLINHLHSADPMISAYSTRALWAIDPHNTLSISCFTELLAHQSDAALSSAQYWSLRALAEIGPEASNSLPAVRKYLDENKRQNQMAAIVAAWKLNPVGPPPVEVLEKTLHSKVHNIERRTAVELLGILGPAAHAAVPTLIEATKEPDQLMREDARAALKQIEPDRSPW